MRTREEIRQYRDDVRQLATLPCDCTGEHKAECQQGKLLAHLMANCLAWILGEDPTYEKIVAETRWMVRERVDNSHLKVHRQ